MTIDVIRALGHSLLNYSSDLNYINHFQQYKSGKMSFDEYVADNPGCFKNFINDFRVARNVDKGKTHDLLNLTTDWINSSLTDDVDNFSRLLQIKGITHGKIMTSLASKILFLNNPWSIFPMDNLTKKAVGLKENRYKDYLPLLKKYIVKNKSLIDSSLLWADDVLSSIEEHYKSLIPNVNIIRFNRFIDKLLWIEGQK